MSHLPLILVFICGFVGSTAASLWWSTRRNKIKARKDKIQAEHEELPNTLDPERFPGEVFTDSNGIRSVYTGLGWATPSVNTDFYIELLQKISRENHA